MSDQYPRITTEPLAQRLEDAGYNAATFALLMACHVAGSIDGIIGSIVGRKSVATAPVPVVAAQAETLPQAPDSLA